MLLEVATLWALRGGDTETAIKAIDEMDRYFTLPPGGALNKKIEDAELELAFNEWLATDAAAETEAWLEAA